jgi:hypothetical protein
MEWIVLNRSARSERTHKNGVGIPGARGNHDEVAVLAIGVPNGALA